MKKSILLLLALASLTFSGCGGIKGLMTYRTDPALQGIGKVHALAAMNSVGFEWEKTDNRKIHGFNIYRGNASGDKHSFKRIGTVGNRYATHFVDTHVEADTTYSYAFTTFSLGQESSRSDIVYVKTLPAFPAVSFVKAYKVAPTVVKILWKPHNNRSINVYIVERSVSGGEWKFVSQVKGRLKAEYIDTFVKPGKRYDYRIIAQSFDKINASPSQATKITL
jgi:fibronectin type 3 domain-containing protein